jgi:putative oxidoreductase
MKLLAPLAMVHRTHSPARDLALLPPRAALAASMLHHGLEKLGSSREKAVGAFHSLGLRPARFFATITGLAETGAGALVALGLFTRPAALAVLVTQAVAIKKVHAPKGFPITRGGFEFNLALMAIATALLIDGPGRLSLHELIEHAVDHRRGPVAKLRRHRSFLSRLVRWLG